MELTFRELKKTELITIKEINRSEIIHEIYKYVNTENDFLLIYQIKIKIKPNNIYFFCLLFFLLLQE